MNLYPEMISTCGMEKKTIKCMGNKKKQLVGLVSTNTKIQNSIKV